MSQATRKKFPAKLVIVPSRIQIRPPCLVLSIPPDVGAPIGPDRVKAVFIFEIVKLCKIVNIMCSSDVRLPSPKG